MNRRRSQSRPLPSPVTANLRFKLLNVISRHEQLKISFNHLKSQIKIGLLDAEDVFASLSIPLMKLVGLKTAEMAEEGRFTTIFMDNNSDLHAQEESYTTRATMVLEEFIHKQNMQLTQLVHLLKQIETQVNSTQDDVFQTLAEHRASIKKFFHKAVTCVSAIHQSSQNNGTCLITLKLLKATFDHVGSALSSVDCGMEDMMQKLNEKMCIPMVEYVKGLKTEMSSGTCPRLLALVEEMGVAMRDGRLELEEARNKVRIAEERNREATSKLKESEERVRKMKEYIGFLEAKRGSNEHVIQQKLLATNEDEAKDDKLLRELLRKKMKYQITDSPFGPKELLGIGTNKKHLRLAREIHSNNYRPITRSYLQGLRPQTPCLDSRLVLGPSPSITSHQALSRKRVTP